MPTNKLKNLSKTLSKVIQKEKDIRRQQQSDRDSMIFGMGEDIINLLTPLLKEIAEVSKVNKLELLQAFKNLKIATTVKAPDVKIPEVKIPTINVPKPDAAKITIPEIKLPTINVPEVKVPTINIPKINVPAVNMPDEMNIKGWVQLQGVNLDNPLPVQLRDSSGKPVNLFESLTSIVGGGGGGGGKSDFFTIKGYEQSAFAEFMNPDGRVKVEMPAGGSGLTDIELRAAPVPMYVNGSFGTVYTTDDMVNSDNRLRVSLETGGSGLTDAELRASSVPMAQASGALWSTSVQGTVAVSGVSGTVGASIVDSSGVGYSGSNRLPVRNINARGSLLTAYVTEDEIREVTVLAGVAAEYHDLVYLMGANESEAAINLDIRATTGGNIVMSIEIPANGTAGVSIPVPVPQADIDATWTVQNSATDNSNTNYSVSALFNKEV